MGVKAGVPAEKLAALPEHEQSAHFTERERAALAFATEMSAGAEVSDACFARLRRHFADAEIVELAFIVGYQVFASTFARTFRLAPQGFSAEARSPDHADRVTGSAPRAMMER